jgi:acyl-CoA thioesterase-1
MMLEEKELARGNFVNPLVYHIVSGQSFFTGAILVVLAVGLSISGASHLMEEASDDTPAKKRRHHRKQASILFLFLGFVLIALSSTAIPYWLYGVAGTASAAWLVAVLWELPFQIIPALESTTSREIAIIGDSITAGVGKLRDSERWPGLLAAEHKLTVHDHSRAGETTGTALARIRRGEFRIESPVVFLEIGGNETLGPTTLRQFEKDLDQPLAEVSSPGRQVMILELPLPPFYNGFGLAQRRLARKHNVLPVPRRSFLSVLAAEESTLDTIHLSGEGQRPMAACVWQLVRSAFSNQ